MKTEFDIIVVPATTAKGGVAHATVEMSVRLRGNVELQVGVVTREDESAWPKCRAFVWSRGRKTTKTRGFHGGDF